MSGRARPRSFASGVEEGGVERSEAEGRRDGGSGLRRRTGG